MQKTRRERDEGRDRRQSAWWTKTCACPRRAVAPVTARVPQRRADACAGCLDGPAPPTEALPISLNDVRKRCEKIERAADVGCPQSRSARESLAAGGREPPRFGCEVGATKTRREEAAVTSRISRVERPRGAHTLRAPSRSGRTVSSERQPAARLPARSRLFGIRRGCPRGRWQSRWSVASVTSRLGVEATLDVDFELTVIEVCRPLHVGRRAKARRDRTAAEEEGIHRDRGAAPRAPRRAPQSRPRRDMRHDPDPKMSRVVRVRRHGTTRKAGYCSGSVRRAEGELSMWAALQFERSGAAAKERANPVPKTGPASAISASATRISRARIRFEHKARPAHHQVCAYAGLALTALPSRSESLPRPDLRPRGRSGALFKAPAALRLSSRPRTSRSASPRRGRCTARRCGQLPGPTHAEVPSRGTRCSG